MTNQNPTVITIGPVRFSYLNAFTAKAIQEGQTPKFSVSAIIPKTDTATIAAINNAIQAATAQGKDSKWSGQIPANLKLPLRDGDVDRPTDEAYKNCFFVNCHATTRPGVIDENKQEVLDPNKIVSGDYGFLNVSFYPYFAGGSRGVAAGFNHLMFTAKGEPLSGRTSADDAFANVPASVAPAAQPTTPGAQGLM